MLFELIMHTYFCHLSKSDGRVLQIQILPQDEESECSRVGRCGEGWQAQGCDPEFEAGEEVWALARHL
jgi:hypothetical protein